MIQAWKDADWFERFMSLVFTLAMIAFVAFFLFGILTGRFEWPAWVDPNAIPASVQHSPIAIEKLIECEHSSSYGQKGRDSFYANAMVECLYASGFEIEYNGEPVRREVTPNE